MTNSDFYRLFVSAAAVLIFSACASASLDPEGAKVKVVNSISAEDLLRYEGVGEFSAIGMQSVEDCYRDLRNQAAEKGAEVVRVNSTEADYCDVDFYNKSAEKRCYKMYGEGFRRKAGSVNATKSVAPPQI